MPTPQQVLDDPATLWTTVTLPWYDGKTRDMERASGTAVWYHTGKTPVPIRWVLVRDPLGEYETRGLVCTGPSVEAAQSATWFVRRWPVETTFEQVRRHLGVETQRQWSDRALARTTPLLMGMFP